MAKQEREFVVDGALTVVEVSVTDPTGLDVDKYLARARVGHFDGLDSDWLSHGSGYDGLNAVWHQKFPYLLAVSPEQIPKSPGRSTT
tara:strand:- start:2084 stop:2344 length:261 start_codon:yes stop_codon:yes gene_type:complete